jgi:selenide,water dikinase
MKIDFAKRRRVMERSRQLGHCICNVRRPCPCDVFTNQGICPCAGERPDPMNLASVKLTELVHNAGCASKIAPADLDAVLSRLPEVKDPAVISGLAAGDDAGIYRIAENLCLVQTVDVFTPCVDDPHLFGRICAANCLSDIYAMGGEPRTALSILAFPSEKLPGEVMFHLLSGAMEVLADAGVALIGGHSIKDDEIKLGFAITGTIDPAVAAALDAPRHGDVLVLTKPLGTGVLTFGQQIGRGHAEGLAAAQASMATLNQAAAAAMREAAASACTDITGFGLFGHLVRMTRQKQLTAEIFADALPAFPGVREAFRQGVIPGAIERNREYVGDDLQVAPCVDEASLNVGFDAQTSGGLLIAVSPARLENLLAELAQRDVTGVVIGEMKEPAAARIVVLPGTPERRTPVRPGQSEADQRVRAELEFGAPASRLRGPIPDDGIPLASSPVALEHALQTPSMNSTPTPSPADHEGCCADVFGQTPAPTSTAESQRAFGAMMRSVQAAGVLDARAKELVLFGLVLASRCAPCFDAHYRKAQSLGITRAELDEVAWCAIAMGGAPVRMFYEECLARGAESKLGSA